MIDMISRFGIGLKPPSYHEIRETCLKKEVDFTQQMLEEYKVEWKKTSCSIMSNGWCWGQNFHATWLYFIGNSRQVNTIMVFGKISSKAQKSPYLHKEASKPIVQAHSTSSHFLAHDPSSWVSSGNFGSNGLEGQEVCSVKL